MSDTRPRSRSEHSSTLSFASVTTEDLNTSQKLLSILSDNKRLISADPNFSCSTTVTFSDEFLEQTVVSACKVDSEFYTIIVFPQALLRHILLAALTTVRRSSASFKSVPAKFIKDDSLKASRCRVLCEYSKILCFLAKYASISESFRDLSLETLALLSIKTQGFIDISRLNALFLFAACPVQNQAIISNLKSDDVTAITIGQKYTWLPDFFIGKVSKVNSINFSQILHLELTCLNLIELEVSNSFSNLKSLRVNNMEKLTFIDLYEVKTLEFVLLKGLIALTDVEGLEDLKLLKQFSVLNCPFLTSLSELNEKTRLTSLEFRNNQEFQSLNFLSFLSHEDQVSKLTSLGISATESFFNNSSLILSNLKELDLESPSLTNFNWFLPELYYLKLNLPKAVYINLFNSPNIAQLHLHLSKSCKFMVGLACISALTAFSLDGFMTSNLFVSDENFSFDCLSSLTTLTVPSKFSIANLFRKAKLLQTLSTNVFSENHLKHCSLPNLLNLEIDIKSTKLVNFFQRYPKLKRAIIRPCSGPFSISETMLHLNLRHLSVFFIGKLDLNFTVYFPLLESLKMTRCFLTNLDPVAQNLKNLISLSLVRCNIQNWSCTFNFQKLQFVHVKLESNQSSESVKIFPFALHVGRKLRSMVVELV
ncbi:hypothetical protein RCL1_005240 [Eukaryota sp. TZLM3-RCL]